MLFRRDGRVPRSLTDSEIPDARDAIDQPAFPLAKLPR
jgi:hypothetical protein